MKIAVSLMLLIAAVVASDTESWTSEKKHLLKLMVNQVMAQQLYTGERTRSEGHSGIKQVGTVLI